MEQHKLTDNSVGCLELNTPLHHLRYVLIGACVGVHVSVRDGVSVTVCVLGVSQQLLL